ncbi:MAG: hypothetical protein NC489_16595 [Ruminococcus flavefaciens]|nr:hypothetical protein [Ruminococcus flavefaciens]
MSKSVFSSINSQFEAAKKARNANVSIYESVMGIDEVLPGSEEEMEDVVDVGSVPDAAYKKVDAMLDKLVEDPEYDDTEAEELVDDDIDEGEIDDAEFNAVMDEACNVAGW